MLASLSHSCRCRQCGSDTRHDTTAAPRRSAAPAAMARTVGVLVFEGFEDLDVFGPVSLLACPRLDGAYRITTVAARPGPVASSAGVATVAAHGFADCRAPGRAAGARCALGGQRGRTLPLEQEQAWRPLVAGAHLQLSHSSNCAWSYPQMCCASQFQSSLVWVASEVIAAVSTKQAWALPGAQVEENAWQLRSERPLHAMQLQHCVDAPQCPNPSCSRCTS